jgi:hypothetical protein
MKYEINTERTSVKNQSNYDATSCMILTEKNVLIVILTTNSIKSRQSSGRSKTSYTKCRIFTKLKFMKYGKIIHYLYWA